MHFSDSIPKYETNVKENNPTANGNVLLLFYMYKIYKCSAHIYHYVPKRATLKVASQMWESPPWQLAFTGPQLAEWQDTWEPLTHLQTGLPGPEQKGASTADRFYTVKPITVGLRCNKYAQYLFPESTPRDKYYEGWN